MDPVEQVWQAFLRSKGMTDDTPIDDPVGFYREWERFLLNSQSQQGGGGQQPPPGQPPGYGNVPPPPAVPGWRPPGGQQPPGFGIPPAPTVGWVPFPTGVRR
jgi:hypothetical protein